MYLAVKYDMYSMLFDRISRASIEHFPDNGVSVFDADDSASNGGAIRSRDVRRTMASKIGRSLLQDENIFQSRNITRGLRCGVRRRLEVPRRNGTERPRVESETIFPCARKRADRQ